MHQYGRIYFAVLLRCCVCALAALFFGNPLYAASTVNIGYSSISTNRLPIWVSSEAKLFQKHGLDTKDIHMGPVAPQALLTGEIQIFSGSAQPLIAAALRGSDIVVIGGLGSQDFSLLAHPSIRTPQDLKGKRIGVSRFGTLTYYATVRMLQHLGLQPDKDVIVLQTGSSRTLDRVNMVLSGTIDATLGQKIDPKLIKVRFGKDLSVLGNLKDAGYYAAGGELVTTKRYLSGNSEVVKRFLMAAIEGIHVTLNQRELALRVLGKYLRENDRTPLEIAYDYFAGEVFSRKPYPRKEAISAILETLEKDFPLANKKNPEDFIDSSFVTALDHSGFIDALYK